MMRTRGPRLTPAQKTEVWRRWRQGESLSAIGRALGRIPRVVHHVVAGAGGLPPPPRQRSRLALTLPEREEVLRGLGARALAARHWTRVGARRLDGESRSAAARRPAPVSGARRLTAGRGNGVGAPSAVAWPRTRRCETPWRPSSRASGRRSRSPAGCGRRILTIRPCTCRTRRSLSVCLCRAAACSRKRCSRTSATGGCIDGPRPGACIRVGTSSMPCRFGNGRPPSRTAPSRGIGKATCSWAGAIPTSPP